MSTAAQRTQPEQDFERLQHLLRRQIRLVRQGNTGGFEDFEAEIITGLDNIAASKAAKLPEYKEYRRKLRKLYDELNLALIALKDATGKELAKVRKSRKTIKIYYDNI